MLVSVTPSTLASGRFFPRMNRRSIERRASGAADSRSGAEAIGGRLQANVRQGPRVMCAYPQCAPHAYWITSSAKTRSVGENVIPSA